MEFTSRLFDWLAKGDPSKILNRQTKFADIVVEAQEIDHNAYLFDFVENTDDDLIKDRNNQGEILYFDNELVLASSLIDDPDTPDEDKELYEEILRDSELEIADYGE
ncbi:hypothetical protein L3556_06365 [Candidatus Synechococcus calcipolaris G9]|uniref:Uncharacterized protein n=1 Tax=Candidatus Synechococcus calcipolaris G9 TaxID=1497997 RepID=A0ABT6EYI9_9SYNE|nr:hypothetical protein [Candidatus Synechococcus calcipolaris]MDG2990559.1 hypothetical protein [Candidatus Synechococcus calcipolaris G9]